ncbi:Biopolymer transport protein exbB [Providencia rustigianii]|uniref:Biopolymer transport protein ExbB n=1 Tax=Providencia rustigianii DSM 4541 TaxID=500637 RepID=D1P6K6_9GAMM|nr:MULTISPECIES: tonB-system energizer ExbB [Providencia]EFB70928.1 tonB-system energizer ExbB [Providencia rustigianii DSM 4541]MTC58000.1 tonB-system energizer ExbB [Providencia rustigianii]SPY76582.1 Biopolymer transport protein exbB [Providencia rustigianii]SUC25803.1 Biopolymer transport protein exbB [Providencia rustigianii]VEB63896.1 Biopolymer transport protein exbB [Providencia rustigianii]
MRKLTASILLAIGLMGTAVAETTPAVSPSTPATTATTQNSATSSTPANTPSNIEATSAPATSNQELTVNNTVVTENVDITTDAHGGGFDQDLSVWGMYQNADVVVKTVMIGLLLASVITWALFLSKGTEILIARRRLKYEAKAIAEAKSLDEAVSIAEGFKSGSITRMLLAEATTEKVLSANSNDLSGIKDRTGFRLERAVAAISRYMGRGNGYLATIGAISPFVGLFGTVWGIMNSFIGIAHSQTTNLAVVAPGIAEALLATAIGLIAAIPAVVIYNIFARMINNYRGQVGDVAAQAALLLGRDLDLANSKAR